MTIVIWAVALTVCLAAILLFAVWAGRQKRRGTARTVHEDQALAVVAEKLPRPVFTREEAMALAVITVRRRYGTAQDRCNGRALADDLRKVAPDVADATLGRAALAAYATMQAACDGAPSPGWALGRIVNAVGYAAVELTELERSEIKP